MSDSDGVSSSSGGGVGILTILLVVFLVLKLTGNIAWPWIWVLSPIWIGAGFIIVALALVGIVFAIKQPSNKGWKKHLD